MPLAFEGWAAFGLCDNAGRLLVGYRPPTSVARALPRGARWLLRAAPHHGVVLANDVGIPRAAAIAEWDDVGHRALAMACHASGRFLLERVVRCASRQAALDALRRGEVDVAGVDHDGLDLTGWSRIRVVSHGPVLHGGGLFTELEGRQEQRLRAMLETDLARRLLALGGVREGGVREDEGAEPSGARLAGLRLLLPPTDMAGLVASPALDRSTG
jgi:hypothetical protein